MTSSFRPQLEQMVEPVARQFAAEKMGLIVDRFGEKLPEDVWRQAVPEARKFLNLD